MSDSDIMLWMEEQNLAAKRQYHSANKLQLQLPYFWVADGEESESNWASSESSNNNMPFTPIVNESASANLGYNLPHVSPADPSVDPRSNTNIDNVLSTIFSLFPSEPTDHTMPDENLSRPSEFTEATWHMLEDSGLTMGSEFDFSDLPPLAPTINHSTTTSSQTTFHNQLFPMDSAMGLGTLAPQAIDNANFFNFSLVGREKTSKDNRTMGSIVRAECRRLCGAIEYNEVTPRRNSHPTKRRKYILPDPDSLPRYDSNSMPLHSPQWGKPATDVINNLFFEAVIDAVQSVPAESTTGCERGAIRKAVKTYFQQLSITYAQQVKST